MSGSELRVCFNTPVIGGTYTRELTHTEESECYNKLVKALVEGWHTKLMGKGDHCCYMTLK